MGKSRVTMQDIADQLGITKVTVSKAINNQPGVGRPLKQEILETAQQMGYINRDVAKISPYKFAVVVPKHFFIESDNFYNVIYYYLNRRCTSMGYPVCSVVLSFQDEESGRIENLLTSNEFNGIFLLGEIRDIYIEKLKATASPLVAVDFCKPYFELDSVVSDNYYNGFFATQYLIKKGHKKIGFVGDVNQTANILDRYYGYMKAMTLSHLAPKPEWRISNNDYYTMTYTTDFNLPEDLPTAFVCHCDRAAEFLMRKLKNTGYRIPQDVSVISFDNTELSKMANPSLTTIDIDKKEIAYKAIDMMINRLRNASAPAQRTDIRTKLIERDSVAELVC